MLTDAKPGAQTRRRGQIVPDGTISVSSKRLVADYQADPARADLRYKHRTLKVTGKIVVTGSASVSLEGESAYGYNQLVVNVALKPGEVSKIAALVHGQSAAFTGVCTGMGDSGSIGIEAAEFANQTAR